MPDQLENDLRAVLQQRAAELPVDASARVLAVNYNPRSPRTRTSLALASAAGLVAAAAVVVSVVGLGAGTPRAFAGWSSTPTTPTRDQASAANEACTARLPTSADIERAQATATGSHTPEPPVPAIADGGWRTVISDTRGPFTMLLYEAADGRAEMSCLSGPSPAEASLGGSMGGSVPALVPTGEATITSFGGSLSSASTGEKPYSHVVGRTGPGVTALTLILTDGTHITASVASGWFLAWWPGNAHSESVEVTTANGTVTQPTALSHCRLCEAHVGSSAL